MDDLGSARGAAPGALGAPGAVAFPPPPPSGAGAPIASSASDAASAWTEHTAPDGRRKYWHNASTGKSTYEKPACFMTATERADATTRWKEAVAPDGRAYFHNLDTKETRWTVPDAVRAAREAAFLAEGAAAAKRALMRVNNTTGDERPVTTPTTTELGNGAATNASTDDPKAAFAACLAACGVTSAQRWDETIRIVERAGDDRFYLLKTASERKKAFHEFQARQKKREREQKRAEDKRRRGAFEAMLREAEATLGCGAPGFAFREVAEDLAKDARYAERFRAVVDDREKEDLYRAHCDALRVRERERRRLTRDDARRRFAERIAAPESGIDFASETWRDARRKMADLVGSHECDRYDQLVAFENAVLTTVDRDEAKRTVAELRRRVAERAARDAFVAFLAEKREAKRLTLRLPWRDFVEAESLEAEEAFRAVSRNASGSRPRELYEDQLEILETRAARDRDAVVAALRAPARSTSPRLKRTRRDPPRSAARSRGQTRRRSSPPARSTSTPSRRVCATSTPGEKREKTTRTETTIFARVSAARVLTQWRWRRAKTRRAAGGGAARRRRSPRFWSLRCGGASCVRTGRSRRFPGNSRASLSGGRCSAKDPRTTRTTGTRSTRTRQIATRTKPRREPPSRRRFRRRRRRRRASWKRAKRPIRNGRGASRRGHN